jgi:hypothetical protein
LGRIHRGFWDPAQGDTAPPPAPVFTSARLDHRLKNDGLIHLCILCGIDKRDALTRSKLSKRFQL